MPTVNLLKCFKDGRARDNAQITVDPAGRAQTNLVHQETWKVIFDGPLSALDVRTNADAIGAGLPVAGNVYDGLFCSSVRPIRSAESPFAWEVTVDYQQLQLPDGTGTTYNLTINKSSASREEQAIFDRTGQMLVNTVGELLPQLPNVTLYDTVWEISWSTTTPPPWSDGLEGCTNSDAFTFTIAGITRSYAKSQAKIVRASFSTTKQTTATGGGSPTHTFVYNCNLSIQIRLPKWRWYAPNEGFRGYNGSGTMDTFRDPPDDPLGTARTNPTQLTLDGHEMPSGETVNKLPDDAIAGTVAHSGRSWPEDGSFELEPQISFAAFFASLHD